MQLETVCLLAGMQLKKERQEITSRNLKDCILKIAEFCNRFPKLTERILENNLDNKTRDVYIKKYNILL